MRYFIISDVHSNREALRAVLMDMDVHFKAAFFPGNQSGREDVLYSLGDSIGYGPSPNECMNRVYELTNNHLIGNHDLGVYQELEGNLHEDLFNEEACAGIRQNARVLSEVNKERIRTLAKSRHYSMRQGKLFFVHSTPHEPERMEYIDNKFSAYDFFFQHNEFKDITAFAGHSHVPQYYYSPTVGAQAPIEEHTISRQDYRREGNGATFSRTIPSTGSALVVVPSVGQPRDRITHAGYTVYDSQTRSLIIRRVLYDFSKTQRKIIQSGLPRFLADRLAVGK